jgi:hypothetical protein
MASNSSKQGDGFMETARLIAGDNPPRWLLFPNQVIQADDLAIVDVALRETGERRTLVFKNRDIQALVGSF